MLLRKLVLPLIFIICVSALWAGDTAVFVDLGFSPDGRTYMFGQHGVELPSLRPWAEARIVDVAGNVFVQNGRLESRPRTPIIAGQDGSGVLQQLLSNNTALTSRHNINFNNQGLPLYISLDPNPPRTQRIEFRDFPTNRAFVATLNQSGSRFHIDLTSSTAGGQRRTYPPIGTPIERPGTVQYSIKRVLIDSTGNSMIFVIEMKQTAANGHNIRYMVETIRL